MTPLHLSLTETEALAVKAARGAGYSWGMAEEAGFATRWLCAQGLPGTALLLGQLASTIAADWASIAPQTRNRIWATASGTPLCPLATGAALCDAATLPAGPASAPITLHNMAFPGLLLPFLSGVAAQLSAALLLQTPKGRATIAADHLWLQAAPDWLASTADLTLSLTPPPKDLPPRPAKAPPVNPATYAGLSALALRTTVPPSARSRAGAGAAGSDND